MHDLQRSTYLLHDAATKIKLRYPSSRVSFKFASASSGSRGSCHGRDCAVVYGTRRAGEIVTIADKALSPLPGGNEQIFTISALR